MAGKRKPGPRCKPCAAETFKTQALAVGAAVRLARGGGITHVTACPDDAGWHVLPGPRPAPATPAASAAPKESVAGAEVVLAPRDSPMVTARGFVAADLEKRLVTAGASWLAARPLLWLQAMLMERGDIEDEIALMRLDPQPDAEGQQGVNVRKAQLVSRLGRVRKRIAGIRASIGEDPVSEVSRADCVHRFTRVCALIDAGEYLGARDLALYSARLMFAPDGDDDGG